MYQRKPDWLKVPYNREAVEEIAELMRDLKLNTVCKEANCPNLGECYKKRTATFMILGSNCTRNCRFCNIACARPQPVDPEEPQHLAQAAKKLGLKHAVVTSVTRDDLKDGGADQFVRVIRALRDACPGITVEVLIPDFQMNLDAIDAVIEAGPDVLNHNMETVKELYRTITPQAVYERSLDVLRRIKAVNPSMLTKTGFMLGLGETDEQVDILMDDILSTDCDILTIGQYLQPSPAHAPLHRYVTPEEFTLWRERALRKGFKYCVSTPLVRSSYRAAEAMEAVNA